MKDFKSNVRLVGRVFLNRYFLFVLNGFLLAAALLFNIHDSYEHRLVGALASNVKRQYGHHNSEDSLLSGSLRLTYNLEAHRVVVFGEEDVNDGYSDFLQPLTNDLMTAKGACGSYSLVLASILKDLNFNVRIPQMKVGETWGGHIIVEAQTKKGWVALDPSFNLVFTKPDGNFASFNDVHSNWNYYKTQVPNDYRHEYAYADVRYTNWEKIPLVMPALKGMMSLFKGKQATNEISIRVFFLRKYRILFYIMLSLYLYSWYRIVRRYTRKRKAVNKNISTSSEAAKEVVYRRA
jgi:hypothetical protein